MINRSLERVLKEKKVRNRGYRPHLKELQEEEKTAKGTEKGWRTQPAQDCLLSRGGKRKLHL